MGKLPRLYTVWANMKSRCNSANRPDSEYYSGKGISYAPEWERFKSFEKWALKNGYQDHLTIDRIEGDKNYEPSNCRFITMVEQQRNKSNNIILEYNGKKMTLQEWGRELKVNRSTIKSRLDAGYSVEEAFTKKRGVLKTSPLYEYKGELLSLTQLAIKANKTKVQIFNRLRSGWSIEDAVEKPIIKKPNSFTISI